MDAADAHALVGVMHGEWPRGAWIVEDGEHEGELTTRGTMFALVLADWPPEVGAEAVARLRARIPYRDGPQTADLKATLREVQHERDLTRPALPAHLGDKCCIGQGFGHFYRDHADDEMRSRVDALLTEPKDKRADTTIRSAFAEMIGGRR